MEEAILYIIYHPEMKAIKLGISDISGRRFKSHKNRGWVMIAYWHFFERDKAKTIETLVLNTLRKRYGHYLAKENMPQNGYTETFSSKRISRKALIRLVKKTIKETIN